jgi:chorismate mutase/prephenate dehydratase
MIFPKKQAQTARNLFLLTKAVFLLSEGDIMTKLDDARIIINNVDRQIAQLFEERMNASKMVAEYKKENNLPIFDAEREKIVITNNTEYIQNEELKGYYKLFIQYMMDLSKDYQKAILGKDGEEK